MQNLTPTLRPVPEFEPVPRKARYDGWTPERQRAFIDALAELGSVKAAAKRINMSAEGAYYLRRQPGAESFRAAWTAALDHGVQRLADIAIDRATEGVADPVFWRGEIVGEKRKYSDRLLMFILRHHLADRYGGPGLAHGTRSRETIEREAQEHCPVCKAAREAAEAEDNLPEEEKMERLTWLAATLDRYKAKIAYERRARRAGEVVAADFTVRQLTCIELMLGSAGLGARAIELWTDSIAGAESAPTYASEFCKMMEEVRRDVWAREDAPPRPDTNPHYDRPRSFWGGPTYAARERAQRDAQRQIAKAQAMWEAAAKEETWAAWRGG
ncbi:hypothetical protein [Sphingomonas sp. GC_Shp_3]|uniref:hypothetical protein n=1 Tax=Sphingomonas sp. GC_Shp_3 TaxID=2937383 RepID=UPI00226AA475|nr:hypothetical protein [Sphingomonas sp. GC_Shp_3]